MGTTISPDLHADPTLLRAVERAEAAVHDGLGGPIEGRTWSWGLAPSRHVQLTMSYDGNTSSRTFTLEQLANPRDVVWEARELWADVLLSNIRRTSDRIVGLLREMAHEELLQGA